MPYDVRKAHPYLVYDRLDFDVPVGHKGDNYDRYYVRMREMDESVYMMRQLSEMLQAPALPVGAGGFLHLALVFGELGAEVEGVFPVEGVFGVGHVEVSV